VAASFLDSRGGGADLFLLGLIFVASAAAGDAAGTICRIEFSWGPSEGPHFQLLRKVGAEWEFMGFLDNC
jgi:hypothetical protein